MSMDFKMDMGKETKEMGERRIKKEFARKRLIQYTVLGIAIILVAIIWYIRATTAGAWYVWVIGAVVIIGMIYSYINWRCPACKKYMGRGYSIRECPHCGAKLR